MERDQIVSVLRHQEGWAVVLTLPVGQNDSITTLVKDVRVGESPGEIQRAAHLAGIELWTALNEHSKTRPTKFASQIPNFVRYYCAGQPVISALTYLPQHAKISLEGFGLQHSA